MTQVLFLLFAITVDSFVYMLEKGATTRELNAKKIIIHSLIFGLSSSLMLLFGLNIGNAIFSHGLEKLHNFVSIIVMFVICFLILYSTFRKSNFVERYNANFNYRTSFRYALLSSIDVFLLGISISNSNLPITFLSNMIFMITFLEVLVALLIGYYQGAKYQKFMGFCGAIIYFVIANLEIYVHFIA